MSLNSLIKDKLSAKRRAIYSKYSAAREAATTAFEKEYEETVKEFRTKLQSLMDAARVRNVQLEIAHNWSAGKYTAKASVNTDCAELKSVIARITKDEEKELEKFSAIDEKAQLSALLPAKERRDEMAAILAEIAKF